MGTVRIAAFADLHLGRKKAPGVAWAREALIDAARNADVIVFTGDLLDKKKATDRDLADGIDLFRLVTEELRRPLVHVWGNHDVGSGMIPRFPEMEGVYRPAGDEIAEIRVPDVPLVFHAVNVTQDPDPRDLLRHLPQVDEPGHIGVLHTEVEGQYTKEPLPADDHRAPPLPRLRGVPHGARPLPRRPPRGTVDRVDRDGPDARDRGRRAALSP